MHPLKLVLDILFVPRPLFRAVSKPSGLADWMALEHQKQGEERFGQFSDPLMYWFLAVVLFLWMETAVFSFKYIQDIVQVLLLTSQPIVLTVFLSVLMRRPLSRADMLPVFDGHCLLLGTFMFFCLIGMVVLDLGIAVQGKGGAVVYREWLKGTGSFSFGEVVTLLAVYGIYVVASIGALIVGIPHHWIYWSKLGVQGWQFLVLYAVLLATMILPGGMASRAFQALTSLAEYGG